MIQTIDKVLESARCVAKGQFRKAVYTRPQYEEAMMEVAKRDAREGESTAVAFARLCEEGDDRIESLYAAARQVDGVSHAGIVQKQHGRTVRQELFDRMLRRAEDERQEGESREQAFARLLDSDPEMGKAYRKYLDS